MAMTKTARRETESTLYHVRYHGDHGQEQLNTATPNLKDALRQHSELTRQGHWAWVEKVERIVETTIVAEIGR